MNTHHDPLNDAVQAFFGLSYLFPYQRLVVTNILEAAQAAGIPIHWPAGLENPPHKPVDDEVLEATDGAHDRDRESLGRQIVILPTGAGKSLCFQLPAILLDGPTLVIYPILSLMADQERRLQERGFAPVILRGGQNEEERNTLWEKLRSGESRFIIANPEVLLTASVMGKLESLGIVHIVIDEAHCVSEWGESFRPSYVRIGEILDAARRPDPTTSLIVTAFTATASAPVLEKIEQYIFGGQGAHRIIGNPDRSNISYAAQGCILRDLAVRDLILRNPRPAIVFCSSRPGTEKLARYLRNELADKEIRFYHAGLSREEKTATEHWFFNNARGILIATCAYGMGVDKADIRTVIHRDCPPSVEAYLQESGRTGRDGLPAKAVLLWGPDDERHLHRAQSETDRIRLSALLDYAQNTRDCRRGVLLTLLNYEGPGDSPESACCDVCDKTATTTLRETDSLIRFFRRNRRRYTLTEAIHVLAQAENLHWSEDDAKKAIQHLLRNKTLRKISNHLWKDKLTV
ncbi:MAG: RecQ family ATP-dependent DNA helicase [Treponema sp.]|jgi:ATP-dependent DNA helicase RecQ|nr:RecQ family ATP-dependent DNA helicase [Treponema sp.]